MKKILYVYVKGTLLKKSWYSLSPKNTIIFVNAALVIKHPQVVLDLSDKWLERVPQLRNVYDGLLADSGGYFTPGPTNPTLPAYDTLLVDLAKLVQDAIENKPNAVNDRNAKWEEVLAATWNLVDYVKALVRSKPEHAAQIAGEAAMRLKVAKGKLPQMFTAVCKTDGQIEITGHVRKHRQCNDWQISMDPTDEAGWLLIKIQPSLVAKTTVTGLKSGTYYWVRHMAIVSGEEPTWTEPIRVKVK